MISRHIGGGEFMRKILTVFLFGFVAIASHADDRSELKKLIKELSLDSYNEHKNNCPNLFPSPEKLVEENPAYFHGHNASSPAWPSIREMYSNYIKMKCSYLNVEEQSAYRAQRIVDNLTDDEVKVAYAYYQSAVGKKIYNVERNVTNEQTKMLGEKMAEISVIADTYQMHEFDKIFKKFPLKKPDFTSK